ncbi:MAG TPA: hypothetical protein VM364_18635 [Vicinamibacterales bacterium]|nr:hypothetical protein [Vicinamibacterales bacterium]
MSVILLGLLLLPLLMAFAPPALKLGDDESYLCGAPTADGSPCRKPRSPFHTRCPVHGAKHPLSKQKATEQMLIARDWVLGKLIPLVERIEAMRPTDFDDEIKKYELLQTIYFKTLDRTGLGPSALVKLEATSGRPELEALTTEQLAQEAERLARQLREPRPEAIDGEVLNESDMDNSPTGVAQSEPQADSNQQVTEGDV